MEVAGCVGALDQGPLLHAGARTSFDVFQIVKERDMKKMLAVALLILFTFAAGNTSANVSGDVRGVQFFYLDGGAQDFPWVLDNQYDPGTRAKIDGLLAEYRSAGVNWIRLLVSSDHFANKSDIHPFPNQSMIRKVNDFMAITRSGANAGRFTIELVLIPETSNFMFTDTAPYNRDKLWYKTWLDNLDYANLGIIMFGGDLSPCYLSGCQGDPTAEAIPRNHGAWIRAMWDWKMANYPTINASYEVIGNQSLSNNNPNLIKKLAIWNQTYTPTNPILAAALYIDMPAGSPWTDYANAVTAILDAYHSVSGKMLWIDEYGRSVGAYGTEQDQRNAYLGFLGATVCWRQNRYPKFAWVAGNDYPYDNNHWYGLVSSFNGSVPQMRPAWQDLALYYNLQACP